MYTRKRDNRRGVVRCLLAIVLVIGMMPASVFAEGTGGTAAENNAVAQVGETTYETLNAAFDAAKSGDTVTVLKDCDLDTSIAVSETVTLDLNSKKITVNIPANGKTEAAFVVEKAAKLKMKNGKIAGKDAVNVNGKGKLTNENIADIRAIKSTGGNVTLNDVAIYDFAAQNGNGAAICMDGGTLTVSGGSLGYYDKESKTYGRNFALNGGAVYADNAAITIKGTNLFYNNACDSSGEAGQYWYGGGAVYAQGGTVTLENNYFFYNQTWDFGGAIHLDQVKKATLTGNRIRTSMAYNHRLTKDDSRGGAGGGIYSRLTGDLTIADNNITGGFTMGSGAGINILGGNGSSVSLSDNTVTKNDAGDRGGGIKLSLSKDCHLSLTSGTISENSAVNFGGGIDYTTHDMPTLKLHNVLISGNQAARGAGVWACPTSETKSYATLGGAVYGNTATGQISASLNYGALGASGDEVRYEGKDTPDKFALSSNAASETTTMTVAKRALGGGLMQWYQDEAGDRYAEGNGEAAASLYTNTDKSFGLHGTLTEEYQKIAQEEASLVITGNTAKRGGGIASNSPIEIGTNADVSVKVEKKWIESKELKQPESIKIDLYRVDKDGAEVKLDRDVELSDDNNWSATFEDLPSAIKSGDVTYTVKEQTPEGWKCTSDSEFDKENSTYHITLTNQKAEKPVNPQPGDQSKNDGTKTGDMFPIWLVAGTALLALMIAAVLYGMRRRAR